VRVGFGIDAHRFGGDGPLVLGGVVVETARGLDATSDGDVAVHAIIDAMLGAAALGDLGSHFPSSDPQWHGASSLDLLGAVCRMVHDAGFVVANVDVTVIAQTVRVDPYREAIRRAVAPVVGLDPADVSVKATTTDHMGFTGRDEGIAAMAVVAIDRPGPGAADQ
jgi:2-C-methyl-D-erythritol 2,4-cyclodiphosphate synthase